MYPICKEKYPAKCVFLCVLDIVKGGHLDFSYLTKLKNIDITEIYLKTQDKSSIFKNHKITKKKEKQFECVPLKDYVASKVIFRFGARNKKKAFWEYPVTYDA